jgi:hypothetical protein
MNTLNTPNTSNNIKLVDDMINEQEKQNDFIPESDPNSNYKTEYKITPSMNEKIYKLDPMIIIGICLIIALIIYIGYKYSSKNESNTNIDYN